MLFRAALISLSLTGLTAAWAQDAPATSEAAQRAVLPQDEAPALTRAPSVQTFVDAPYPPEAKAAGIEATVGLIIEIDETGKVIRAQVSRPAGHGFDQAALEAAEQMIFLPAQTAEGPIAVAIEFDYNFVLERVPVGASDAPVTVTGRVLEMGSRAPIAGINVRAVQGDWFALAQTDQDGRFEFRGTPAGTIILTTQARGYTTKPRKLKREPDELADLTMWLKRKSNRRGGTGTEEMVVTSERPEQEVVRRTISVREIKRIPGTFGDPVRVIQNLPGTARAPFGTGMVVVRGSNPEDTAFYVDGIRVPLIYHLGGYVSILNEDIVGSVDYLPGGYGVEYGRSGGGVINVKTSQDYPERFRVEWSTDILDSGGVVQGRAGKDGRWGITATGRRSYIDAFIPLFTKDTGFTVLPYWWDYQVKVDDLGLDNGRFTVLMMGFGDKLYFGSPDSVTQGTDQDTQGDADLHYGAHRLIVQWARKLGEDLTVRLTPSVGYDEIGFTLGDTFRFSQTAWLLELRADALWSPTEHFTLRPGVDVLGGPYKVEIEFPFSPEALATTDPLAEREDYSTTFEGSFWSPDPFLEAQIRPLKDADTLLLVPGLRLNTFFMPDYDYSILSVDPRMAVRWTPLENTTFKGGTGLYHQPPQGPDLGFEADNITVDFERTWSTEVGLEHRFSEAVEADFTVYNKKLDNLIVENEEYDSADDAFFINKGSGRVRGLEVMVRHNPVGRFFGWISYTLSKAERKAVPQEDRGGTVPSEADDWRPFEFDQTHILVAVAGLDLPHDWGVSGRFRYTTGNPYTPYAGAIYDVDQDNYFPFQSGDVLSERLASFTSLDLRVDKRFTFKRWWLETYVDMLNVVRGENPEALHYNYDYTQSAPIRGLPFIVSPGIRAEFSL
jgi:TonB family protein